MPKRPCLDCSALTDRADHRCPPCASTWHARRDHRRGTAHQRGYDHHHATLRATLLPHAYGTPCPRCGDLMIPGQALDLGHPIGRGRAADPTSRADHIEHADCNRGAGVN